MNCAIAQQDAAFTRVRRRGAIEGAHACDSLTACPRACTKTRRGGGTTLIELLVTLAVAAIIVMIAIPSFQNLIAESRATAVTNALLASIQRTRSEAARRGTRVTLCASNDGATCMTTPDFAQGWIIVSHEPSDGNSELLHVHQPDTAGITVNWHFGATAGSHLTFTPTGQARTSGGALVFGSLRICHSGEDRRIILNSTGRPRVAKQNCTN